MPANFKIFRINMFNETKYKHKPPVLRQIRHFSTNTFQAKTYCFCYHFNKRNIIFEVGMKKKSTLRFPVARKGYDREAVDGFIALEQAKNDELQLEQRERINALKQENDALRLQLETLKGREEQIKLALVAATENANRLSQDVKRRYSRELDRLRLFRAKWENAYEQMKDRYHFDKDALNVESVAVSVEIELKKFLAQDFSLNKCVDDDTMEEHFRREVERLTARQLNSQNLRNDDVSPSKNSDELKSKLQDAESKKKAKTSVAFSLDDALNPTETLENNFKAIS